MDHTTVSRHVEAMKIRSKRRGWPWRPVTAAALLAAAVLQSEALAQQAVLPEGWNTDRALELVAGARARRQEPLLDESLSSYRAEATGFIYFFLDREGVGEPVLLRSDQVALELFWAQPDRARQVIHGMRSENHMPIRDFNYYLDRYTVVHDGFGDEIRIGHGRDVRSVTHPLAPDAEAIYDYRLADSVSISLPGWPDPIRVYEIQVRPKDADLPAFVGSLYIERARNDLVRMAFTFTPSAYIDRRNQRIEITLENGLWERRYWLPREQRLMVRRELPELDVDMGTVIRTVVTMSDYDFDVELPPAFFSGPEIVFRGGLEQLARYSFSEDLLDGLELAGVGPMRDPANLLASQPGTLATEGLGDFGLSGALPALRLYLPNSSAALRFNRAEGLVTGMGASYEQGPRQLAGLASYAWGPGQVQLALHWRPRPRSMPGVYGEAYLNRGRDLDPGPAESGLLGSISAAIRGEDYQDLFLVDGVTAGWRTAAGPDAGVRFDLGLGIERQRAAGMSHETAPLDRSRIFRPLPRIESGTLLTARGRLEGNLGSPRQPTWTGRVSVEGGLWSGSLFCRTEAGIHAGWSAGPGGQVAGGEAGLFLAALAGQAPPQHLYYLGGRGTLPGHPFRSYAGDRIGLLDADAWYTLVSRYLRARVSAGLGWTWLTEDRAGLVVSAGGAGREGATAGPKGYMGVGVAAMDGGIRLEYFVPFPGGHAGWMVSMDPRFWSLF